MLHYGSRRVGRGWVAGVAWGWRDSPPPSPPHTRLIAQTRCYVALCVFLLKNFRASGEAILGTLKYFFLTFSYVFFFRASGEAILGTLKYFSERFLTKTSSRLRRVGFRYTKMFSYSVLHRKIFRAAGEAILGTLKYFPIAFYTVKFFAPPARRF